MSKLIVIASPSLCVGDFFLRIQKLCVANVDAIVLRQKEFCVAEFRELAHLVNEICAEFNVEFVINQYFDVACELKSSFWMTSKQLNLLSSSDLSDEYGLSLDKFIQFKRESCDKNIIIQNSYKQNIYAPAHSISQAKLASMFADILVASHIFYTDCKTSEAPKGINLIKDIKAVSHKSIYALGGINELNFKDTLEAGADGVCIMSLAMQCENEYELVAKFKYYIE
ncbi:thiamine phosphate synthase [Campylobacter sp. faydin G-24]|uniref:Thiamine phosphate synthase n=1 Tax=Campylobacter anatolicus TaxID=2829105 RepID=A0ABS5HKC2_9BACT|nr:thiamine phosphate synthase [Campylobacter anatolicus]MBR8463957.1 thiamine phosphate synthase [Campylobacter anatolicus]MBR8465904.1 thiamine phosphate synthase [Campylobacter anatolicus]